MKKKRTPFDFFILFLKGLAMGAADVVPGVSGGTIAFITGIYEELIQSIRSFNFNTVKDVVSFKIKKIWRENNIPFLLVLGLGIGSALISLARLLSYLLENHKELLWAFFFGLIIASAWIVGKKILKWTLVVFVALTIGTAIAYFITVASPAETPEASWFIFISGMIAICAMILPGISGSFILLLLGKYKFMIEAIKSFDLITVIVFILGAIIGILSFSHLIHWMLKKYHDITVALLTGFMVGSLNKVWPWKQTIQFYIDRHGESKPLVQQNVLPFEYEQLTGSPSFFLGAVVLAIIGFVLVYLLELFGNKNSSKV